jgi:hypothetical protein
MAVKMCARCSTLLNSLRLTLYVIYMLDKKLWLLEIVETFETFHIHSWKRYIDLGINEVYRFLYGVHLAS